MVRTSTPSRRHQVLLIVSTILGSWLGMQLIHECGHVLGAWLSGGSVARVNLSPLTLSRTDVHANPRPLAVAWAGPLVGVLAPLLIWGIAQVARRSWAFVLRFFAGFCLIANGLYLGIGSLDRVGDCDDLLRHGAKVWQLWLFGCCTAPLGLWLWHRQGRHFGLAPGASGRVHRGTAYGTMIACMILLALGYVVGSG